MHGCAAGWSAQGDPHAELLLDLPDGFARLLVHGLAQFHSLVSTTRLVNGNKYVVISRRTQQQGQQQPQPVSSSRVQSAASLQQEVASKDTDDIPQSSNHRAADPDLQRPAGTGDTGADWLLQHVAITCTDVVMALRELGGSFDQPNLMRFMKTHVHGSSSDDFQML